MLLNVFSYTEVQTMFRGLLLTMQQIRTIEKLSNSDTAKSDTFVNVTDASSTEPDATEPEVVTYSDNGAMCCSRLLLIKFNVYCIVLQYSIQL